MIVVKDKKLKKKLEPQFIRLRDQDPSFDRCDFSNCKLTESDLRLVWELVNRSTYVKEVTLTSNRLGDEGAKWLAGKLRAHPSITATDVRFNTLGQTATDAFIKAAKNNTRLTKVLLEEQVTDLDSLGLGVQGAQLNPIPPEKKAELEKWLQANQKIQQFLRGEGDTINLKDRGFNNDLILKKEYYTEKLVNCDLTNNELTRLPELILLKNLKTLDFSKNKVASLPSNINCLVSLERLIFNDNLVAVLPPEIGALSNLKVLECKGNKIGFLPDEMANLQNLTELDVRKNKIKRVPFFLADLKKLVKLLLADNDLEDSGIPKNLIDGGGDNLLSYLKELSEGHKKLCRMRLMIVGHENVGKTTLLRALTQHKRVTKTLLASTIGTASSLGEKQPHENDSFDQYNLATDGIDITEWELDDDIMFSAWDFAGQEVYYATHQFFLSHRAIYCICFNIMNKSELSRVEYWLQSINTRGKGAPVILVGTHMDDKDCSPEYIEALWTDLKKKYTRFEVQHFFAVSGKTKQNVIQLEQAIETLARELKASKFGTEIIPDSYLLLEKRVKLKRRELQPPILSLEDFKQMALGCGVREENIPAASNFLSEMGVIVYFAEVDSGLHDMVILSPQWVTAVFASVVTLKHNFIKKDGMLALNDLYLHIWNTPEFPKEMHPKLLQLLIRFEICFHIIESNKLLIPSLLPEEKPRFDLLWSPSLVPEDSNQVQFKRNIYLEFTPKGFCAKLIIRLLYFTQPHSYWQYGILVSSDDDFALVELEPTSSLLVVSVRGAHKPAELFRLIIETIDILVDSWFNIKAGKYIPCPHCLANGAKDENLHLFLFGDVEAAVSDGRDVIPCEKDPKVMVPLNLLAPDVVMQDFSGDRIDMNDLKLGKILGSGSFGRVYRALWKDQLVAVKEMKLPDNVSRSKKLKAFNEFRREVWLMSGLKHPNVVNLLGFSMNPFLIIMEMVPAGDLYKFLNDKSKVCDWVLKVMIALDMSRGMEFLHTQNPPLLHRDLKTPNVFLASTAVDAPVRAKVADFGFSSRLYIEEFKAKESADREVNNPTWLAPEVLAGKGVYGTKSDVYAMGVMMWEVMVRQHPFSEYDNVKFAWQLEQAILDGKRPTIPDDPMAPPIYKDIIRDCWAQDPLQRPEFADVTRMLESIKIENGQLVHVDPEEIKAENRKSKNMKDQLKTSQSNTAGLDSKVGTGSKLTVQGAFLKKIETSPVTPVSRIYLADNIVWVGGTNGNMLIYNAENASLGEYHSGTHNSMKITCISSVNKSVVWTGGDTTIQIWSNEEITKWPETRGTLQMKSTGLISGWENKYCVLSNGQLSVQPDKADQKLLHTFNMESCSLVAHPDKKRPNCICLTWHEKKKFYFSAKDTEQYKDWFSALTTSIEIASRKKVSQDQSGGKVIPNNERKVHCMLKIGESKMWVGCSEATIHIYNTVTCAIEKELNLLNQPGVSLPPDAGIPSVSCLINHQGDVIAALYDILLIIDPETLAVRHILAGGHSGQNTQNMSQSVPVVGDAVITQVLSNGDRLWSCSCSDNSIAVWNTAGTEDELFTGSQFSTSGGPMLSRLSSVSQSNLTGSAVTPTKELMSSSSASNLKSKVNPAASKTDSKVASKGKSDSIPKMLMKLEISGFHGPICMVLFGNYVWTGGCDGRIRLWNARTLECTMELQNAHSEPVHSLALIINKVWSGSADTSIGIWK